MESGLSRSMKRSYNLRSQTSLANRKRPSHHLGRRTDCPDYKPSRAMTCHHGGRFAPKAKDGKIFSKTKELKNCNPPNADTSLESEEEEVKCVICLDTQKLEEFQPLLCGHTFHKVCFETWMKNKNFCPMCRTPVDMVSAHYLYTFRFFVDSMTQWALRPFTG